MTLFSALGLALAALLLHKGRAVLTGLGIVIGIASVIAMVSAGEGARYELNQRLDRIGKNLVLLRAGSHLESGAMVDFSPFTKEDTAAIRRQVGPLIDSLAPVQLSERQASTRSGKILVDIAGSTPELQQTRNWKLVAGRFFNHEDLQQAASVCLIGQSAIQKLFPDRPNPVGQTVQVDRLQLRIIGVTEGKGYTPAGADQDNHLFMPLTTLQRKLAGEDRVLLVLAAARPGKVDQVSDAITQLMRQRHRIHGGAADDFEVSNVQEMGEVGDTMASTLQLLIAIIASISLMVAGIGIMNIMLVSVTERTREIGIRLSVGARPQDILVQFLLEAVLLAVLGGFLGIALGLGGAAAMAHWLGWPLIVSPTAVLLTVAASAGVGVFFGYYPAWKASRLQPVEAMRTE